MEYTGGGMGGGGQNGLRLLMAKAIVIKATKQIFLLPAARRRSVF